MCWFGIEIFRFNRKMGMEIRGLVVLYFFGSLRVVPYDIVHLRIRLS